MSYMVDLTGRRFGKLTVLNYDHSLPRYGAFWRCQCDCGNITVVRSNDLQTGNTKSCGCYQVSSRFNRQSKDLTGLRFGRLVAIRIAYKTDRNLLVWECKCDCGNTAYVKGTLLMTGATKSCGCICRKNHTTEGLSYSKLYARWNGMKDRCYNKNSTAYKNYGGRGIYVCDEWKDDPQAFYDWGMSTGFSPELSIDRIDNDGPYAPWNCRWVTPKTQLNNNRLNKFITDGNNIYTYSQFADKYSYNVWYVGVKLRQKWSKNAIVHRALHPELNLRRINNEYVDKDGFIVLIPEYGNTNLDLDT